MANKVAFYTLGCKVNSAESDVLAATFQKRGFAVVDFLEPSDIYVINTCTVTHQADARCRQVIRQAKNRSPEALIAVIGCYAQADSHTIAAIPGVDLILGNSEKMSIFDHLNNNSCASEPIIRTDFSTNPFESEKDMAYGTKRTRAFLKVQDGCSYTCTYCIIPQVRGPSISRPINDVLHRIREIRDAGYLEIVLTAVNLGEYKDEDGKTLLNLLDSIVTIDDVPRIRLTSIEPNCFSEDLVKFVADSDVMCRHFHVPLQSGSNDVLNMMKRRYLKKQYGRVLDWVGKYCPDAAVGTDVMVGFPEESEQHFEESLSFIESLPITYLHVFRYSPRSGTKAPEIGPAIHPEITRNRSRELQRVGLNKKDQFLYRQIGTCAEVLFETKQENGTFEGFTRNYARVQSSTVKKGNALEHVLLTEKKGMVLSGYQVPNKDTIKPKLQEYI